jgi:hypothetical protein
MEFRHERLVETGVGKDLRPSMRVGSNFTGNPATMHEMWGLG